MNKKVLFISLIVLVSILLLVIAGEITVRAMGYSPWQPENKYLKIEPDGPLFERDNNLGYHLMPGQRRIWLDPEFSFQCTINEYGQRITVPSDEYIFPSSAIWLFGCSYTFGWGVDDTATFAWKLQEALPDDQIINYGVPGYSNIQNLVELKQLLKSGNTPKHVVLVYAGFHDMRNVMSRSWEKVVAPYNSLGPLVYPKGTLVDGELGISYEEIDYRPWWLQQTLALVHYCEIWSNESAERRLQANEVSQYVVKQFQQLCAMNSIQFHLVIIVKDEKSRKLVAFAEEKGIKYLDISLNLNNRSLTNEPYDSHPNGKAHSWYADRLSGYFSSLYY